VRRLRSQNRLTLRIFCIDGPSAASPAQVDVALPVIARTRLFQGDHVIDQVAFGETVYQPLHDRMFATSSAPAPADLDEWRRVATAVAEAGLPLHVHAELATTIDAFLDQIEAINAVRPVRPLRWALAHVNQIGAAQLQRMQRLGLYAAVHPWAVINGGFMHRDFGDAAFDMPALRTIQASGVRWGFGSDGMAANQYPPFTVLGFAVTGRMAGGRQVNRQTIGREDALLAYTRNNASLLFQDGQIGSLQPGKLADLVVLDRAYLAVPAVTIASLRPVMTMIGGRVVYDAGVGPR
jgi:predicted amidohydrolase YtcJ